MRHIAELIGAARAAGPVAVAVAAAHEDSVLRAVAEASGQGIARFILVGDAGRIRAIADECGLDLSGCDIADEPDSARAAASAVSLVRAGKADALMKGILDTSVLLRAAFSKESGINAGRLASHVAVLDVPSYHKLLVVSDAAINIAPDLAAMKDIIDSAVDVARAVGAAMPKVAVLAAIEKVNAQAMPCTVTAALLAQMNRRGQIGRCIVDGPLALDVAVSAECARVKGLVSEVAGDADILIVPDIEAGNILYKSLVDLAGAGAAGVVMGAARPIVLTSRADSPETKLASIALSALLCRGA